jgi:hypothetical protein
MANELANELETPAKQHILGNLETAGPSTESRGFESHPRRIVAQSCVCAWRGRAPSNRRGLPPAAARSREPTVRCCSTAIPRIDQAFPTAFGKPGPDVSTYTLWGEMPRRLVMSGRDHELGPTVDPSCQQLSLAVD